MACTKATGTRWLLGMTLALMSACGGDSFADPQPDGAVQPPQLDAGTAFDAAAPQDGQLDVPDAPDAQLVDASTQDEPDASVMRRPRPIERGTIQAPITGKNAPGITPPATDLARHGYVEEEFLLTGEAQAYAAQGEQGLDGRWGATVASKAPYSTRILVRRPALPEKFNGTVLVEWLNVTGSIDTAVGYVFGWEELVRGGYVYVAVSVQKAGVDSLKLADGERYAALSHPGDTYAYDIYAQAGAAVGWPGALDALHGAKVERLIAYGESQSAMRMITFTNAIQPLTHVYDGIVIHSRAGWGAPVGSEGDGLLGNGKPVHVRTDSDAHVLQLFTESELFLALGPAFAARQPDNDRLRTWEMAGTAHADERLLGQGTDIGCGPANPGHQHYVVKAGLRAMHRWLQGQGAPPAGAPITVDAAQKAIARDANGNALGGVRTPAIDVPLAQLSGEATWNPTCLLFGMTVPFTSEKLRMLYPSKADYVAKVTAAARSARDTGFLLAEDETTVIAEAMAAAILQ